VFGSPGTSSGVETNVEHVNDEQSPAAMERVGWVQHSGAALAAKRSTRFLPFVIGDLKATR